MIFTYLVQRHYRFYVAGSLILDRISGKRTTERVAYTVRRQLTNETHLYVKSLIADVLINDIYSKGRYET